MIKHLTKHGNSYALIIDRPILELLKIDPEAPLDVTTDGTRLTVQPLNAQLHKDRIAESLKKINKRYGRALKRLAE